MSICAYRKEVENAGWSIEELETDLKDVWNKWEKDVVDPCQDDFNDFHKLCLYLALLNHTQESALDIITNTLGKYPNSCNKMRDFRKDLSEGIYLAIKKISYNHSRSHGKPYPYETSRFGWSDIIFRCKEMSFLDDNQCKRILNSLNSVGATIQLSAPITKNIKRLQEEIAKKFPNIKFN